MRTGSVKTRALRAVLRTGRTVRVRMTGSSMRPLLREPMILEIAQARDARIGDVVVFEDRDTLVAHRVFGRRDGALLTSGDAQPECVEHVPAGRVVGRVLRVFPGSDAPELRLQSVRAVMLLLAATRAPRAVCRLLGRAFPPARRRRFAALAAAVRCALTGDRDGFEAAWARDERLILDQARRMRLLPFLNRVRADFRIGACARAHSAGGAFAAARIEGRARAALDVLAAAGIRAIPLKGAYRALYEPEAAVLHPSSDVDLLVRPVDRRRASRVLRENGYRERAPEGAYDAHHHAAPLDAGDGVPVEIHDALSHAPGSPTAEELERHACDGDPYPYLDAGATLLHLLVHQLESFAFRDAVLAAGVIARHPELTHELGVRGMRLRALRALAASLAGKACAVTRLESLYLGWLARREDLPAFLRDRSQAIEALFALAAGDAADARYALLGGIAGSPAPSSLPRAYARVAGRVLLAPAAALYAALLPRFSPARAAIRPISSN